MPPTVQRRNSANNPKPIASTTTNKKCKICNQNVTPQRFPGLSCFNCGSFFHAKCVDMSDEALRTLIETNANWPCMTCKTKITRRSNILPPPNSDNNNVSPSQNTSRQSLGMGSNQTVGEATTISDLETKINQLMADVADLRDSRDSFVTNQQFYSDTFDEYQPVFEEAVSLVDRVTELERENMELKATIETLSSGFKKSEQEKNRNNLVLTGIPVFESEECCTMDLVVELAETLNIEFDWRSVTQCNRLNSSSPNPTNTKPPPVLLKFDNTRSRDNFKKDIRYKKREMKYVRVHNRNVDYYASDHLTHYFSQLLYAAKDFARDHQYAYVWYANGKIMLRKNQTADAVTISKQEDLHNLH